MTDTSISPTAADGASFSAAPDTGADDTTPPPDTTYADQFLAPSMSASAAGGVSLPGDVTLAASGTIDTSSAVTPVLASSNLPIAPPPAIPVTLSTQSDIAPPPAGTPAPPTVANTQDPTPESATDTVTPPSTTPVLDPDANMPPDGVTGDASDVGQGPPATGTAPLSPADISPSLTYGLSGLGDVDPNTPGTTMTNLTLADGKQIQANVEVTADHTVIIHEINANAASASNPLSVPAYVGSYISDTKGTTTPVFLGPPVAPSGGTTVQLSATISQFSSGTATSQTPDGAGAQTFPTINGPGLTPSLTTQSIFGTAPATDSTPTFDLGSALRTANNAVEGFNNITGGVMTGTLFGIPRIGANLLDNLTTYVPRAAYQVADGRPWSTI